MTDRKYLLPRSEGTEDKKGGVRNGNKSQRCAKEGKTTPDL